MDWAPVAREDRQAGHAQQQRPRDRAHRDDLEHHEHVALHRADLQEPVRQIEPLRRVHRAESVPREGPQGARPLESGDDRQPEVLRRRAEGHRQRAGRSEGEVSHGVRHRLQVDRSTPPRAGRSGSTSRSR